MTLEFYVTATADTRFDLAKHHLEGAARLARAVAQFETRTVRPLGDYWPEVFAECCSVVFLSTSAIESYLNRLLIDSSVLVATRSVTEKARFNHKVGLILEAWKPGSSAGVWARHPGQRAVALMGLRNELLHYKAEWRSARSAHLVVERRLKANVGRCLASGVDPFPLGWLTSDVLTWVVGSARDFIDELARRSGQPNPLVP